MVVAITRGYFQISNNCGESNSRTDVKTKQVFIFFHVNDSDTSHFIQQWNTMGYFNCACDPLMLIVTVFSAIYSI